jgi:hypothetical protein
MSMIERRQALGSREFLAPSIFFSLIFAFCFWPGLAHGDAGHAVPSAVGVMLISAVTFVMWRYRRRDYASPRRNGRRI